MIKINLDPTFDAEVEITVPGRNDTGNITLTFKYMGREEYVDFIEAIKEEKDEEGKIITEGAKVPDAFPLFVVGWGLTEEFNEKNIRTFLNNYPSAYHEIFREYSRLLLESRIKN